MLKVDKKSIKNIVKESNYSQINSKAAEMSFYLLLSLFPFLIFTISSIAYIPIIQWDKYIYLLQNIMPESAYDMVSSMIYSAIANRSISLLITSFFLTVWASSRAVTALIKGINKSYNIMETRSYIKIFVIALIFTIVLLLLIFSSMIFLVYGEKIGSFLFNLIGLDKIFIKVWNICRYTIGISTVIIILLNLYRYTPNKKISLKEAIPGAVVSTFGWIFISLSYSYYTNSYARYELIYGSLGGIIVLITWLYLSSWSILIGVEVNARLYFKNRYWYKD
ncbi:MAG: YihY/virulence factor BrkB family protein [Romboutsia sp.]